MDMVITDAILACSYELRQKETEQMIFHISWSSCPSAIFNTFTQVAVHGQSQGLSDNEAPTVQVISLTFIKQFLLLVHQIFPTHCAKKISTLPNYKPEIN